MKHNPEMLSINSNKSNVSVLIQKDQYANLTLELNEKDTSYVKLPKDPTINIQSKC